MATPPVSKDLLQEAVNLVEQHRTIHYAAKAAGIHGSTLKHRYQLACLAGIRPTVEREPPKPFMRERLGRTHLVIPDCQIGPDVPTDHLEWIGNYIVEKKPDVIVQIGDFADMPSLNSYTKGKRESEGKRLANDISSVSRAMERLITPMHNYNRTADEKYQPEMHLCLGNHEYRMEREVEENPRLEGMFHMGDLGYEDAGWTVHDFLKIVEIDGVQYSHFFISGSMGRPVSSAAALLKARGGSATMGHVQRMDVAYHPQTQQIGLMCGTCYLHDERYLTPQGNNCPRQIIMKHEVDNGRYDLMAVSLRFLQKRYS